MQPAELRCEYRENPLGVDSPQPRLSWVLQSAQRGEVQTGFQLLAASSLEILAGNQGDLWDSGQVKSAQTVNVPYAGKPLRSAQQVFWKARAWDKAGQPSAWSAPASWTMGLLNEPDWQARWIGADGQPGRRCCCGASLRSSRACGARWFLSAASAIMR